MPNAYDGFRSSADMRKREQHEKRKRRGSTTKRIFKKEAKGWGRTLRKEAKFLLGW